MINFTDKFLDEYINNLKKASQKLNSKNLTIFLSDVTLIFNKKYVDNVIIKKTDKNFKEKIFLKNVLVTLFYIQNSKLLRPSFLKSH